MIKENKMRLSQRVLGAVDLAIEFATLGEYGLEEVDLTSVHGGRRRASARTSRERRGCNGPTTTKSRSSCWNGSYVR